MSNSEANDDGHLSLSESLVSFSDQRVPLHSFTIRGRIFTGGLPAVINRTYVWRRPRASKASVEAMPKVKVASEEGNECSICLDGLKVGDEAKEMPCKHRFHGACIEKWMGMSTLCPLCRFSLPAESEEEEHSEDGDDYFSLSRSILDAVNNGSDIEDDSESEEDIGGEWESSIVDDYSSLFRSILDAVNNGSDIEDDSESEEDIGGEWESSIVDDYSSLFRSILDAVNNGSDIEDDSESEEDIGGEWESSIVDDYSSLFRSILDAVNNGSDIEDDSESEEDIGGEWESNIVDDYSSLFRSILDAVNNGSDIEDDSESEEDIGGEWESSTVDDDDASVGDNVTFRFKFSIE